MICEHCYQAEATFRNWCQPCLDAYNENEEAGDRRRKRFQENGYLAPGEWKPWSLTYGAAKWKS